MVALRNLPIKARIAMALVFPVLGLLALAGHRVVERHQLLVETQRVRQLAGFGSDVGALAHQLQRERGASSLHLGSRGGYMDELAQRHAASDQAVERFQQATSALRDGRTLPAPTIRAVETLAADLGSLAALRQNVRLGTMVPLTAVDAYGAILAHLFEVMGHLPMLCGDDEVAAMATAYTALLQGKERAGMARAVGAGLLASGIADPQAGMRFLRLAGEEQVFLKVFRTFARPAQVAALDDALKLAADYERLHNDLSLALAAGLVRYIDADEWFLASTTRVERIREVEDRVNGDLLNQAEALEENARRQLTITVSGVVILLAGTGLLVLRIVRGIVAPLGALTDTMTRLAEGDASV
ncbi:MAG: nitrate- and nitrite sensing domain-containing protein, partial [Rhodospirillales bacterium]|nr:nitrate- and nitrite sensing domain-containing protein [Rhodospirillales bacterium]